MMVKDTKHPLPAVIFRYFWEGQKISAVFVVFLATILGTCQYGKV